MDISRGPCSASAPPPSESNLHLLWVIHTVLSISGLLCLLRVAHTTLHVDASSLLTHTGTLNKLTHDKAISASCEVQAVTITTRNPLCAPPRSAQQVDAVGLETESDQLRGEMASSGDWRVGRLLERVDGLDGTELREEAELRVELPAPGKAVYSMPGGVGGS